MGFNFPGWLGDRTNRLIGPACVLLTTGVSTTRRFAVAVSPATGEAATVRTSCKKAFSDLEAQVKKHQEKLRKDYEWKRKRRPSTREVVLT